MWLFAGVSLAICTPCVRAALEALFAELTVMFVNHLALVALATVFAFVAALVLQHCGRVQPIASVPLPAVQSQLQHQPSSDAKNSFDNAPRSTRYDAEAANAATRWHRHQYCHISVRLTTQSSSSSASGHLHGASRRITKAAIASNGLLATLFLASAMLPTAPFAHAAASTTSTRTLTTMAALADTTWLSNTTVPYTLADNKTALAILQTKLTMCTHSKVKECIDNVTAVPEFGTYKQGPGMCVAFDTSYVPITYPLAALPNRYLPIAAETANAQGFQNRFSKWSSANREQFPVDCPLLYNNTVAQGQDALCCTENQYESLKKQVRMIPGECTACKENLRNVWCQFACHPSNSQFIEVNQVRLMPGDAAHAGAVFPAIEDATFYVSSDTVRDLYDNCIQDANFALICSPTRNCTDGFGALGFMGDYNFNSLGSPLQITIRTMQQLPKDVQEQKVCACGQADAGGCLAPLNARLASCVGVCGSVCAVDADKPRRYHDACVGALSLDDSTDPKTAKATTDSKWDPLSHYLAANLETRDVTILNIVVVAVGVVVASMLIMGYALAKRSSSSDGDEPNTGRTAAHPSARVATDCAAAGEFYLSRTDQYVASQMKRWGVFVSSGARPQWTIAIVLLLVTICCVGLTQIEVETDPVKLWVAESSRSYKERSRYGELFMPFYRSEQVVLVPKDGGTISRVAYLREAIRIQQLVADIVAGPIDSAFPDRVALTDVCWKVTGTTCTVNAITQYFQNRMDHFDVYDAHGLAQTHFANCMYAPANQDTQVCDALRSANATVPATMSDCPCLASFGAPMNLYNTYLGGFPASAETNTTQYLDATAIVSTALVYNYYDKAMNAPAIAWERAYIARLKREATENALFHIYFMAETSVQDEIEVESSGDVLPVALSYSLMIVYVSLGINRWSGARRNRQQFFQTAKISVGFLGIMCIILAVASTIGLFAWCGVKLQLVIIEVVPFLTLAIGVDNIFLIVHAVSRMQDALVHEEATVFIGLDARPHAVDDIATVLVSEGLAYIGPSIFMASVAESVAFAFGCISPMPAVLWFAAFAAVAVVLNFGIQMTLLVAIVTLDKRRELKGCYDIFCWRRAAVPEWLKDDDVHHEPTAAAAVVAGSGETKPLDVNDDDDVEARLDSAGIDIARTMRLARQHSNESRRASIAAAAVPPSHVFDRCVDAYARMLAHKLVKLVVLLAFLCWTLLSIVSIESLRHGLPQAESMPSESYLIDYFNAIDRYLATGAPVFFVVEGGYKRNPAVFDLDDERVAALFCKSKRFCSDMSLPKLIDVLANDMDRSVSHLSNGVTYSWLDDFWSFVNPDSECCRVDAATQAYIPIVPDNATYSALRPSNPTCLPTKSTAPPVARDSFMSLFSMFASASASSMCSYGGGSIYRGQFSVDDAPLPMVDRVTAALPPVVLNSTGFGAHVTAFSYMLVSTANPTQQHFIDGYKQARRAAQYISDTTGVDVWVYSITYVFFDQYLTIVSDTYKFVGLALGAIFVIHAAYFGSVLYPLVVALTAANIVIQVMGLMAPNDILLNGLSMVNLVIAAGISVEFCGHYVRMFAKSRARSGDARAKDALRKVLVSVLFGITITKVVGLSALTLADSRIFLKYYFRMYMSVVLCGVLNGMVFLPVLLSVCVDIRECIERRRARGGSLFRRTSNEFSDISPVFHAVETSTPVKS